MLGAVCESSVHHLFCAQDGGLGSFGVHCAVHPLHSLDWRARPGSCSRCRRASGWSSATCSAPFYVPITQVTCCHSRRCCILQLGLARAPGKFFTLLACVWVVVGHVFCAILRGASDHEEAEAGVVVQLWFGIGCLLGQFVAPAGALWKDVSVLGLEFWCQIDCRCNKEVEAGTVVQLCFGICCLLGQFVAPAGALWKDVSPFRAASFVLSTSMIAQQLQKDALMQRFAAFTQCGRCLGSLGHFDFV